jgi:hypothetical protein
MTSVYDRRYIEGEVGSQLPATVRTDGLGRSKSRFAARCGDLQRQVALCNPLIFRYDWKRVRRLSHPVFGQASLPGGFPRL